MNEVGRIQHRENKKDVTIHTHYYLQCFIIRNSIKSFKWIIREAVISISRDTLKTLTQVSYILEDCIVDMNHDCWLYAFLQKKRMDAFRHVVVRDATNKSNMYIYVYTLTLTSRSASSLSMRSSFHFIIIVNLECKTKSPILESSALCVSTLDPIP